MSLVQPDRLLGRSPETSILLNVYYAALSVGKDSPASSILIHGDSGLGKTSLAETMRRLVLEDDGYFIQVKFDQLGYASAKRPHSIIASAFAEYCSSIEQRDEDTRVELENKLRREIKEKERDLLFEIIPALRRIIGDDVYPIDEHYHKHGEDQTMIPENFHKLNHLIRKFVSVITQLADGDPIVFLLDDLQWANKEELDLLQHIMLGVKNPFIFVFTCRHMDANQTSFVNNITYKTEIKLGSLGRNAVGDLVSETLGVKPSDCATLSRFIYNVTTGNPFFAKQQIISLREKNLLRFEEKWVWDDIYLMEEVGMLDTDVMSVVSEKIERLPLLTQQVLKICSCIGSKTDLYILGMLICETHCAKEFANDKHETLAKKAVSVATQEGVLTCHDEEVFFVHDSFSEAAYSLLDPDERDSFHLKLGKLLVKHIPKTLFHNYLFTVAVQLARGISSIEEKDRISTIRIFLNAGDKSNSASAFPVALSWYSFGISLLREQDWLHHHQLCADLYLKAADSSSITGDYDDTNSWLAIIFDRCKENVVDLLSAYYIQVRKLGVKDEDPRALDFGLEALKLVNIRFPSKNMRFHIMGGFVQTYSSMKRKGGVAKLTELPLITDEEIVIALRILKLLIEFAFHWNQELLALLIFSVVDLNMVHGMSPGMPSALALYGAIISRLGLPIKEAYQYGEAALALQRTIRINIVCPYVTSFNHAGSFLFIKKFSDCLEALRSGWDSGLAQGDVVQAMICAEMHGWVSLISGKSLQRVSRSMVKSCSVMKEYNTMVSMRATEFHQQAVAILLGNPACINKKDNTEQNDLILDGKAKFNEMVVSVFLTNHDLAWKIAEKLDNFGTIFKGSIMPYICSFYRGMSAFAMLHLNKNWQIRKTAKACLNHLRKGKKKSPLNLSHQTYMLEAEYAVFRRKYNAAEKFYNLAIVHATDVTHEHALACERFANYYVLRKDHSKAYEQIREAYRLYSKWGSRPKRVLLKKKYPRLSDEECYHLR